MSCGEASRTTWERPSASLIAAGLGAAVVETDVLEIMERATIDSRALPKATGELRVDDAKEGSGCIKTLSSSIDEHIDEVVGVGTLSDRRRRGVNGDADRLERAFRPFWSFVLVLLVDGGESTDADFGDWLGLAMCLQVVGSLGKLKWTGFLCRIWRTTGRSSTAGTSVTSLWTSSCKFAKNAVVESSRNGSGCLFRRYAFWASLSSAPLYELALTRTVCCLGDSTGGLSMAIGISCC